MVGNENLSKEQNEKDNTNEASIQSNIARITPHESQMYQTAAKTTVTAEVKASTISNSAIYSGKNAQINTRTFPENAVTRSAVYAPTVSSNAEYGVIVLNQRQVQKYYQWRQDYPSETFHQFMERLRRGSQNSENLRTPRLSHVLASSTGVQPVYMSTMTADSHGRHTTDQYRHHNMNGVNSLGQNGATRQTADARLEGNMAGHSSSIHGLYQGNNFGTLNTTSNAGNYAQQMNGNQTGGATVVRKPANLESQYYSHGNTIRVQENYSYTSNKDHTSRVVPPKADETPIIQANSSTSLRPGSPKTLQIQSSSSPNLHKPGPEQFQPLDPLFSQRSPGPIFPPTPTSLPPMTSTQLGNKISFGMPQSPAAEYMPTPHFSNAGRTFDLRSHYDDAAVNVLVVDEYQTVPQDIRRRISDIAEQHGCKPRVVVIADDYDEDDREMDDLMKTVYERVSFPSPRSRKLRKSRRKLIDCRIGVV